MCGDNVVQDKHVIGLTGSFGSGCSYVAKEILERELGYKFFSLSEHVLKPLFKKETDSDPETCPRHELQEFGDRIRNEKAPAYLAEIAADKIREEQVADGDSPNKWVIDSIRNPAEVRALRRLFPSFFLFGVYAEKETRWNRVKEKYGNNKGAFDEDDQNDTGQHNVEHGQKVGDCFDMADVVLRNETQFSAVGNAHFQKLLGQVSEYVDLTQRPRQRQQPITKHEALMAIAYAMSQRSSCLKRKVGAIIVDGEGNVISSGYNEVPPAEMPCAEEYRDCYRTVLSNQFADRLKSEIPGIEDKAQELKDLFRNEFKILDYCRALHAEENAILNLARNGISISLENCVLYTTTYPCRMCANKIVRVGLKNIVYVEPYPDPKSAVILENAGIDTSFFQGVTFKAYSRLYGEEK